MWQGSSLYSLPCSYTMLNRGFIYIFKVLYTSNSSIPYRIIKDQRMLSQYCLRWTCFTVHHFPARLVTYMWLIIDFTSINGQGFVINYNLPKKTCACLIAVFWPDDLAVFVYEISYLPDRKMSSAGDAPLPTQPFCKARLSSETLYMNSRTCADNVFLFTIWT